MMASARIRMESAGNQIAALQMQADLELLESRAGEVRLRPDYIESVLGPLHAKLALHQQQYAAAGLQPGTILTPPPLSEELQHDESNGDSVPSAQPQVQLKEEHDSPKP